MNGGAARRNDDHAERYRDRRRRRVFRLVAGQQLHLRERNGWDPHRSSLARNGVRAASAITRNSRHAWLADAPTVLFLYPFRYRDPLSGKWVKARYIAERHEIAKRYREWKVTGEPEVRRSGTTMFSPWR